MRKLSRILSSAAHILSCTACAAAAYGWRDMQCGIAHSGYSAPAAVGLLQGLPFAAAALLCALLAHRLRKSHR